MSRMRCHQVGFRYGGYLTGLQNENGGPACTEPDRRLAYDLLAQAVVFLRRASLLELFLHQVQALEIRHSPV